MIVTKFVKLQCFHYSQNLRKNSKAPEQLLKQLFTSDSVNIFASQLYFVSGIIQQYTLPLSHNCLWSDLLTLNIISKLSQAWKKFKHQTVSWWVDDFGWCESDFHCFTCIYRTQTLQTIDTFQHQSVYVQNFPISDPKLGSILRLCFIKILTFKKVQHHDHRVVVKAGITNILPSTCPPYCRNYPRRSSANWGRLETKLPGRVVDYDWHIRLLAQNCSFFPNNTKNYARFWNYANFLRVCFSRRKHKTSPNYVFVITRTQTFHGRIWVRDYICCLIKVLCEQTRELTHDFLDYV